MPPTFGYAIALFLYICGAGVGLAVCLLLALAPPYRPAAKRIAGGIFGSFPGVFLFQLLSAPIVAVAWVVLWGIHRLTGDLTGAAAIVWALVAISSTFGAFAVASAIGFLFGWRIGSSVASGTRPIDAFRASVATFSRPIQRLYRALPSNYRLERP